MSKQSEGLRTLANLLEAYPELEANRLYPDQPLDISFTLSSHEAVDELAKLFNTQAEHPVIDGRERDLYWVHIELEKRPNEYFPGVKITATHHCTGSARTRPRTCDWGSDAE